ncbi:MFS transporter [Marinobacterium rhizophilum]|uniref:MFS transporter n=1 Tax=Marinobacterium rhizophilum TaxID=420402 RepID=UPI0003687380|nr:MFS transporter [Marinobacterium rhizophilum]
MPAKIPATSSMPTPGAPGSAWSPLRHGVFRMLWFAWLTANLCMWMNDVAASWLMLSLSDKPLMVALVQAAATLPVFLLGAPSGALADILDRRRYFIATQVWVAMVGAVLCLVALAGGLTPTLLLLLTFANGIGLAMRWPVFSALVPELVPRAELGKALALNGVAMNGARIVGPMIAGVIIGWGGSAYVFLLNALLSMLVALALIRWKHESKVSTLPAERFFGAMRVGFQYFRQSPEFRGLLLRAVSFFLFSIAAVALLPLVAKQLPGGNASTFTLLLATMGGGAILSAMLLPRVRQFLGRDQVAQYGILLNAVATLWLALAPNLWLALPALLLSGLTWLATANSFSVSVQLSLPDWIRARGMSMYQMAMMGGSAIGAALWGQVASLTDIRTSLIVAALSAVLALLLVRRIPLEAAVRRDLTPSPFWKMPQLSVQVEPHREPVMVQVEFRIDPARAEEFMALMQESRGARLRNGALSWELFQDVAQPGRFVEYFVDGSWVEHMRQHERVTAHDQALWERKQAFQLGDQAPSISHFVARRVRRG